MSTIQAHNLSVIYKIPNVRFSTLKEMLVNKLKGTLAYRKKVALSGVSFAISPGECVGIIGENGGGKSTLLKTIAGILPATMGGIDVKGKVAPLIELGAGFDPELTGRENVYLSCSLMGLTRKEIDEKIKAIEDYAELGEFFTMPVKTYSSGMYMRLGFACTTVIDAEIILIDEILAVGDINFQRKCLNTLGQKRASGATLVIVSHDLTMIQQLTTRVLVVDKGQLIADGPPKSSIEVYTRLMQEKEAAKGPSAEEIEQQRVHKLTANFNQQPLGSLVKITDSKISMQSGELTLSTQKPWVLKIKLDIKTTMTERPIVGFAILKRGNQQRMFGNNTKNMHVFTKNAPLLLQPGSCQVEFRFHTMPLASGEYQLITAVHDADLVRTLDLDTAAAIFEVRNENDTNNFDNDLIATEVLIEEIMIAKD